MVEGEGLIVFDSIVLSENRELNWRLHSSLKAKLDADDNAVLLDAPSEDIQQYRCSLFSHRDLQATLTHGYAEELSMPGRAIASDAKEDVVHLNWQLAQSREHKVIACCVRENSPLTEVRRLIDRI